MITVITDNTIKESREEYVAIAKAFAADARNDKGCLGMTVYINDQQPDHVVFISSWEEKADWECHVGGPAFSKHIPKMGPYYVAGTDTILDEA